MLHAAVISSPLSRAAPEKAPIDDILHLALQCLTWLVCLQDALSQARQEADEQAAQASEKHGANSKLQSDVQEKARDKNALSCQLQMLQLASHTDADT